MLLSLSLSLCNNKMKSLSVIPFVIGLVGYDMCIEDSPEMWKNGPEYTFRVKANSSMIDTITNKESCLNTTIFMKCRPFSNIEALQVEKNIHTNGLQCYIEKADNYKFDIDHSIEQQVSTNQYGKVLPFFEIINKTFQIIYNNENGIEQIKIYKSCTAFELFIFEMIAHHLNLDSNIFNKNEASFTIDKLESSLMGFCQTKIDVSTKIKFKSEQWKSKCHDKIHLETYTYEDKYPLVVINKTVNTAQCADGIRHYLGKNIQYAINNVSQSATFTEFVIAPQTFGSLSIVQGIISIADASHEIFVKKFMDLRLIAIQPAIEPLRHQLMDNNYGELITI